MSRVRTVDTNVLIGLVIKRHIHHQNSFEYVVDAPDRVYAPPKAEEEFLDRVDEIRRQFRQDVMEHQTEVETAFADWGGKLGAEQIKYARSGLLNEDMEAYGFLDAYYENLLNSRPVNVDPLQLEYDLQDIYMELGEDACARRLDGDGWRDVVTSWTRETGQHDDLQARLLIYEGDDPIICVQAHHIATVMDDERDVETELGTADGDFIDHKDGEPRARCDDILAETALSHIEDLR